jgi:hypothetical protein
MGVSDLNKETFLSRRKGDIFIEARHQDFHFLLSGHYRLYILSAFVEAVFFHPFHPERLWPPRNSHY